MGFDKVGEAVRARHHRDRAARLHARAHAEPRVHHPRRGAEHHARADEDVPHAHRLRRQGGGHRRRDADRPAARPEERPGRGAPHPRRACAASRSPISPPPTWCATRWWRASSMPTKKHAEEASAGRSSGRRASRGAPRAPPAALLQALARAKRRALTSPCASSAHARVARLNRRFAARTTRPTCCRFAYGAARPRRHRAVPSGDRARGARAGQDARARTTRTSSCTACCTCAATITQRRSRDAARMETAPKSASCAASASAIPYDAGEAVK